MDLGLTCVSRFELCVSAESNTATERPVHVFVASRSGLDNAVHSKLYAVMRAFGIKVAISQSKCYLYSNALLRVLIYNNRDLTLLLCHFRSYFIITV
jgi:hypothetical protein